MTTYHFKASAFFGNETVFESIVKDTARMRVTALFAGSRSAEAFHTSCHLLAGGTHVDQLPLYFLARQWQRVPSPLIGNAKIGSG